MTKEIVKVVEKARAGVDGRHRLLHSLHRGILYPFIYGRIGWRTDRSGTRPDTGETVGSLFVAVGKELIIIF